MATVTLESLTREAKNYNNALRSLPFYTFMEASSALKLNLLNVTGKDIEISYRRKAGILRPYVVGLTPNQNQELIKFHEAALEPKLVYGAFKDNILNYKDKKVLSNAGEAVDMKAKKHPLEYFIMAEAIKSYNEDIIFQLFFGERSDAGTTPATAFNGFFTNIDTLTAAGEIAANKGNLSATGAIAAPTAEAPTAAYDKLVAFIKSASPFLRRSASNLYISLGTLSNVREAFKNKVAAFNYPTMEEVVARLKDDADAPMLNIVSHEALGTGSRLVLTKPGMFDVGFNVENDKDYVQVRSVDADPNIVQFWMQSAIDTRVKDVDKKVFLINDQTSTAAALAGDY